MGLFSRKNHIGVSSSVYNLAGDIEKRPQVLKEAVVSSVLSRKDIAPSIVNSYITGSGIRLRNFDLWANDNFDDVIGLSTGTLTSGHSIDLVVLAGEVPAVEPIVDIITADIGLADYSYWADQYVAVNYPMLLGTAYLVNMDEAANEITITFVDTSTVTFTPTDFDESKRYLYVSYVEVTPVPGFPPDRTDTQIFIYQENSGNSVLDEMFKAPSDVGTFFPFIPFRINNLDVKDSYTEEIYKKSAKAFKKATNSNYDDVRENINSNAAIADIDYCYAIFGTSLNTKENACKKYIYNFFKMLMEDPTRQTSADYDAWVIAWNAANAAVSANLSWRGSPYDEDEILIDEPPIEGYPTLPRNSLTIGSTNALMNYNITLNWCFIDEETGSGLLEPTRKKGELWFTIGTTEDYTEYAWLPDGGVDRFSGETKDNTIDVIYLNWQVSDTEWRRLTVRGLEHVNMIYGGKSVSIRSKAALEELEESGFIIPLHEDVFRALGLKDRTQMGTGCCYLMFNCYEVKKEKWYQTAFFRFILIAAAVVITVLSLGGDGGTTLGSTIAVVSFDLTYGSLVAIVVGFVINAAIAMILIKIAQEVASAIFGEEIGEIIGTIAGIFLFKSINNSFSNGQSILTSFGDMLRADNLMQLMIPIGDGYAKYIEASTIDMKQQIAALDQEFKTKLDEISGKTNELFGTNDLLDPTKLMEIYSNTEETRDSFLQRTLMVGTDIAALSINMLNDFVKITLSTELPIK